MNLCGSELTKPSLNLIKSVKKIIYFYIKVYLIYINIVNTYKYMNGKD